MGSGKLLSLEELNLSYCERLEIEPDGDSMPTLRRLDLSFCTSLLHPWGLFDSHPTLECVEIAGCDDLLIIAEEGISGTPFDVQGVVLVCRKHFRRVPVPDAF